MSLQLDERRRAMLLEMGVRVWTVPPADASAHDAAAVAVAALARQTARVPALPSGHSATPPADAPSAATPSSATPPAVTAASGRAPLAQTSPAPLTAPAGVRPQTALQPLPAGVGAMDWATLEQAAAGCQACTLCRSRKNSVFGVGSRQADWLIVGEVPGENEDLQGEPFVGQAGKLLDNMLKAVGLSRQADTGDGGGGAYIAHVVKCRPPANRNPLPDEVAQCEPYLRRQVELLQPKVILALGRFAVQSLLQSTEPLGKLRGRVHAYHGVPVIVSYDPAYLLRSLPDKAKAWADLCLAMDVVRQG